MHPSSASIYYLDNTPSLTCIYEEIEPVSQKSSLKRRISMTYCENIKEFQTDSTNLKTTILLAEASNAQDTSLQINITNDNIDKNENKELQEITPLVAKAVAYLRRKSIAVEEQENSIIETDN